jgi:hypothetical protein
MDVPNGRSWSVEGAAMKVVDTEQPRYRLPENGDDDVHLRVDSGEFQAGFARVRLGQQFLADARLPMEVVLGKASELATKRVRVRAIISQHISPTKRVRVVYVLTPGKVSENTHSFEDAVEKTGDSIEFRTTIRLVGPEEP